MISKFRVDVGGRLYEVRRLVEIVLSGSSPCNSLFKEARIDGDVDKAADACHALDSSLSGLEGFSPMSILWMIGTAPDCVRTTGAVKLADGHPVGAGV